MSNSESLHRRRRNGLGSGGGSSGGYEDEHESPHDSSDIVSTKSAAVVRSRRWRQALLVLSAFHRFRYTLALRKEKELDEDFENLRSPIRALGPALNFYGEKQDGSSKSSPSPIPTGDYDVTAEQLATMTRDHDFSALQNFGGVKGLVEKLKTDPDNGIHDSESSILDRKNVFGSNAYSRKTGRRFWRNLLNACRDTTLIILMIAAAASLALGIKTKVVRDGRSKEISIFDIVVGDVIPLNVGDLVPADGILISGCSLAIDESNMTGESELVNKDHKTPFLMSRCKVAYGCGNMLVTSVGINTGWGLLMASISTDNREETPLRVRLNEVAVLFFKGGLVHAVSILVILLVRFFTGHTEDRDGKVQFVAGQTSVGDAIEGAIIIFLVAVGIVVIALPAGLPLAVTLTFKCSIWKMIGDSAVVRRLSVCEIMGSATTICIDKTGILTLNEMTVVEAYICGKKVDLPNNTTEFPPGVVSLLIESVAQNTTASVPEGGNVIDVSGPLTEKAILQWGIELGMNFEVVRSESSIIHAIPFNSEKKRGGVAVRRTDSKVHVHWKGAAEIVLAACTRYMDRNENLYTLDEGNVEYFKKVIEDMSGRSLRCVAIAYRPLKGDTVPTDEEELANWELPEGDLVLLAIVGLKDPCRPGVREAVQLCVKAGVKVRLVTGDNLQTAKAIALECGILGSDDATEPKLIKGESFHTLSVAERLGVAERISVLWRSSPNDKLLLVQALRKRGHVVAVTGDGTNDARALHEADIGLAMGIQGTEVAKESSDIIILDDNFTSVVKVVLWGRSVYAHIQKFIQFQLTLYIAALITNIVAAVTSGDVLLNGVQVLWVNLIMDTLGALARATKPPTDRLMDGRPVSRREPLITNIMWRDLLIQALYQVSVILVLNSRGREILHSHNDPDEHANKVKNTLIFNSFFFSQMFNEFIVRRPAGMNVFKRDAKNRLFVGIMALTVGLQVVIVMFLGKFTSTVRPSWQLWLVSIVLGFISCPCALVGKLIPVPERPFGEYIYNIIKEKHTVEAHSFKAAGEQPDGTPRAPPFPIPTGDYDVNPKQLATMTRDHDFSALQNFGGVKGLAEKLKTNPDKGIHDDDANIFDRKNVFGSNTYPRRKGRSIWRFLFDACRDTTLIILMVADAASLALSIKTEGIKEGWYDGGSIALAVIIVIVVTAISDYKQSLKFQNLNEEKQNIQLEVVRGGRRVEISIFDIVVGDVIPLKIGDQVPADGVLISGHSLAIDESSMTGESKIVNKDHKSPFLMSGCKVADGYGTMLATSVGINTEWGLLMASISEDNGEETPLQVRLNGVVTFIGIVGLVVAVSVLVILIARYFTGHTEDAEGRPEFVAGKTSVGDAVNGAIKIFTVAVTIVVVAVPEGLPLAVTLTLAYSMRKMMADKALVRRLSACETMGSATTICSDKTGTLTLNLMTVVEAYVCGKKVDPPNNTSVLPSGTVSLLTESVAQNTTGSVFLPEGGKDVEVSGSPTEKAILQWGLNLGMNFEAARSESSIIQAFPFSSEKKRGGVAVRRTDSEVHVHWKGAAEIVLAACTRYMDSNEQLVPLDEGKVEYFKKAIEDMARGSLRCVAIAYRPLRGDTVPTDEEELTNWELPEGDLVLLAIVGLKDPCRPGVRDAVQLCVNAGVKVRMVTGDNVQTAKAIALECGILESDADATEPNLIEGKSFRALSDEQRLEIAERISVMGRSSPNDKLLLVQALRKRGHVVAVTGDGTNDAPALHEADIGLAMGIQGTEVAKESSDIIILDDNFASVVKVVRWGRSVYANIQKVIQFQLTVNVAALVINVVAAVSSGDVPLNAVQLLWVNLIMDTLGALALATEPPTDHLMDRHPVGRREPLITNIMWRNLLIQAFYQVSVLLVLNFRGRELLHSQHDPKEHAIKEKNTLIFNAFVFAQIFNEFNARKPDKMNVFRGVTKNRLFMGIIALTVVLQVVIVMFLGKFTSTVRLSWQLWLVSIVIGVISWPLALVGKQIPIPESLFAGIRGSTENGLLSVNV